LARVIPYLQRRASDVEWDAPVHMGQSFAAVDNELLRHIYPVATRARQIIAWAQGTSGRLPHTGKVQRELKKEHGKLELDEFVPVAQKLILGLEQLYRNEGYAGFTTND
jgi:hypothetical protein